MGGHRRAPVEPGPRRFQLRAWKGLMRATLAGYWLVAALGVAIYYLWFLR